MGKKIVIGVGIANHPINAAGNSWAFLQWALAFREAGWEVWLVENLPSSKLADNGGNPCQPKDSIYWKHWSQFMSEFDWIDHSTLLVDGENEQIGTLQRFARSADLFLNISGHFKVKDIINKPKFRLYLDLDPVFTQIWAAGYGANMNFEGHDHFLTVGTCLQASTSVPLLGKKWVPTLPPVSLKHWTATATPKADAPWTTVTHWYGYPAIEYNGEAYDNKSMEFEKVLSLPGQTRERLEIATDLTPENEEYHRFRKAGWSLREAGPLNEPWQRYRDYLAQSKGEFCVAKNGYVKAQSGWFSDRSACYLALGRPVILQETGWTDTLPSGEGLLPFTDRGSAAKALATASADYQRHSAGARRIAEKFLSGTVVVESLLEKIF